MAVSHKIDEIKGLDVGIQRKLEAGGIRSVEELLKESATPQQRSMLARKLGINGTPHFLVGTKSIPGAPDDLHDQLETLVSEFRKDGCTTC